MCYLILHLVFLHFTIFLVTTDDVDAQIFGYASDPGAKHVGFFQFGQLLVRFDDGILGGVFGVMGRGEQAEADGVDALIIYLYQLTISLSIAGPGGGYQFFL